MINEYIDFKHENRVKAFLDSVSVPTTYIHYDYVLEYSQAKQFLKGNLLNPTDRKDLNHFTVTWVQKHGNIDQALLNSTRKKLTHYGNKALNQQLREKRLQRNAAKKIAKLKKTV